MFIVFSAVQMSSPINHQCTPTHTHTHPTQDIAEIKATACCVECMSHNIHQV